MLGKQREVKMNPRFLSLPGQGTDSTWGGGDKMQVGQRRERIRALHIPGNSKKKAKIWLKIPWGTVCEGKLRYTSPEMTHLLGGRSDRRLSRRTKTEEKDRKIMRKSGTDWNCAREGNKPTKSIQRGLFRSGR